MHNKQVNKEHYEFNRYMDKKRWMSVWHQLDEVLALSPHSVLEIGPGPGLFKAAAKIFGLQVETMDLDPELQPNHVGSATSMPFENDLYDVVCAFQMLEHLPFDQSQKALAEMARVARNHVVISLPDAKPVWRYIFYVPKLGEQQILVPRPLIKNPEHKFDGEHYWEINKAGFELEYVISEFAKYSNLSLKKTYRVKENPYHRFFVYQKLR